LENRLGLYSGPLRTKGDFAVCADDCANNKGAAVQEASIAPSIAAPVKENRGVRCILQIL
jgi:hypothetical protein